jgi:cellulose synthase operon protein C
MPTLLFPERDTLRQALASGKVAPSIYRAPAAAGFDASGKLCLNITAWLTKELLVYLTRLGVRLVGSSPPPTPNPISCWQEALPLEREALSPEGIGGRPVLFDLPGLRLTALAGEIERLGRRPWAYRWQYEPDDEAGNDRLYLKTVAPPFYAMLRALDAGQQSDDVHAFIEQAPGVWVAAGWRHPLAAQIQPPPGKIVLLRPPSAWEWQDDLPFAPAAATDAPPLSGSQLLKPGPGQSKPVAVALRLAADLAAAGPELWVVRDDPLGWLGRFAAGLDGRWLGRFTVALAESATGPILLLRTLEAAEPTPVVVDLPDGYRRLLKLANLYVPCGRRLSPLPRRDTLRRLLAGAAESVTWLRPLADGGFATESAPFDSFRPLREWVEHQVEERELAHDAWKQSSFLDVERFVEAPPPTTRRPSPPLPTSRPKPAPVDRPGSATDRPNRGWISRAVGWLTGAEPPAPPDAPEEEPAITMEEAVQAAWTFPKGRTLTPPAERSEALERGKALETRFLSSLGRLTPNDRLELWPELGGAYAQTSNLGEAAICWLNALWEQSELSPLWAWGWLRAEAVQARWNPNGAKIAEWLAGAPTPARARAVAAFAVWAARQQPHPRGFIENLSHLQAYLDRHEEHLPVRAAWLARSTLVRLSRGDVLGLARSRDQLFERLHRNGLSLDLDAPAFLRFAESGDPDRFNRVRKWLTDKRRLIQEWVAQLGPPRVDGNGKQLALSEFGLQAETVCTSAYADLLLAWGLARLGEKNKGAGLRDEAFSRLDQADPIHAFLRDAFDFRIDQAREAKPSGGPLPEGLMARLEALSPEERYRIDKLRQFSRILEPNERLSAYWASTLRHYAHWEQLRKQLIELPGLETAVLNERVRQLLDRALAATGAVLPVVLLEVLDAVGRLTPELAQDVLRAIPKALDLASKAPRLQFKMLEKGLLAVALFDRPALVQPLTRRFIDYLEAQRGLPAAAALEGLTGEVFRCLRRLGMKREASEVLGRVRDLLTDGGEPLALVRKKRGREWPGLLRTLLPIAAAYYYSGQDDLGHEIINMVPQDLYYSAMPVAERTALALGYAATLGQIPVRLALERYSNLFQDLKQFSVNGWNTHYTLQPLQLIDTVVLAVVSDDFTLGPAIRGWLDDDEYLVRQRINAELNELMAQQGVA